MRPLRPAAWPAVLLLGLALLTACDSGDPVERFTPADVAATYGIEAFSFEPDAQAVAPLDLRDTLDTDETFLVLDNLGNFFFKYELRGGTPVIASGAFEVTEQTVRVTPDDRFREAFRKLLLDVPLVLRRAEQRGVLTYEAHKNVDLEPFDPDRYAGLTSLPGTVRLRMEMR